ncbi:glycosyl transferase family, a/b domain-containing protein [Globomyces pollinis-pini]|nr:glycosyl transferase family, a/b domain-containing protein [Globomyces pollinis-pini]
MTSQLKQVFSNPAYLTPEIANEIANEIMDGHLTSAQIGGFLITMKLLGKETQPPYIASIAKAMKKASLKIDIDLPLVDIVGTGGDGQDTFNVSTAASIVAAGAGCKIAKHGSRASSSACGSADVLETLGCKLENVTPDVATKIIKESNFCFLFAQLYHPAMKAVAGPRRELGVRTIFNLYILYLLTFSLGPLTNPANPKRMVVGVFSKDIGMIMAKSLQLVGVERAWVVCGAIGLDEISPEGSTNVWELENNTIIEKVVSPKDFGLPEHPLSAVRGGNAEANASTMNQLLDGTLSGPVLDFVLLNSAAVLYIAGLAKSLPEGVALARQSITSGKAKAELLKFAKLTQL